jgi:hypothetical protein
MSVQKASFAGSWYPDTAEGCRREIEHFMADAAIEPVARRKRVGGIVPHAGWVFSGSIACNVIRALTDEPSPDVMVLFGMHLPPAAPCYILHEGRWQTPLGDLRIAEQLADHLLRQFDFDTEKEAFAHDNTIELQLPFIKYFFEDVQILPMGIAPSEKAMDIGRAAVETAEHLGLKIKVIGSTDLTHYGPNYGFMPQGLGASAEQWVRTENDRKMIDTILSLKPAAVLREARSHRNACCSGAVAAAMAAASALGTKSGEQIAYATSRDKHPADSFVGYVGIVF